MVLVLAGCKDVIIDPSPNAMASGDITLAFTAGQNPVRQGVDVFRVTEGETTFGEMQIVAPQMPELIAGELSVRYKGRGLQKNFSGRVIRISWRELVGRETFDLNDDGIVQMVGRAQWNAPDGPRWIDVQGYAFLIVLRKGYSPVPLNSGLEADKQSCAVDYTSSGRSAVSCLKRD